MPYPALFFADAASFWGTFPELRPERRTKKLCFTNGCFDLIHPGHVRYLADAGRLGDFLAVGLNSDRSVARLKGPSRPLVDQMGRAMVLLGLKSVDAVICFEEDTPEELIAQIQPDVLVKGGDYEPDAIPGRDTVAKRGGSTMTVPFLEGYSTTEIVKRIQGERRGGAAPDG